MRDLCVRGAVSALLEVTAVGVTQSGALFAGLCLHLAAVGMVWLILRHAQPRWAKVAAAAALLMPGYGLALVLLVILMAWRVPPPPGDLLSEFVEHVGPRLDGLGGRRRRAGELALLEHLSVEPLIDMLDTPDVDLKRSVIEAMARRRGRKLVACIQRCLNDPRPEVYQFAMAKLSNIQERYTEEISQAMRAVEVDPKSKAPRFALAALYRDYLESGLVDAALVPFYRGLLHQEYTAILQHDPDDSQALLARGQLDLRRGQPQAAAADFRHLLQRDPTNPEALFGMVEVEYTRRNWAGVQAELGRLFLVCTSRSTSGEILERVAWLRGASAHDEPGRTTRRIPRSKS